MKSVYTILLLLLIALQPQAQTAAVTLDKAQFFEDEAILEMTFTMNLRRLLAYKMKPGLSFPASLVVKMPDSSKIMEPVSVEVRGNYRKQYCYVPPLKVNFRNAAAPKLSPLGSLKLVNVCDISNNNTEYLLKEYLTYKIYNLITDKSFRVRLLKIIYIDSFKKRRPISVYGFFLEDVKDMAKRNQCLERKRRVNHTELTDRQQMTRVALFEYMIGNLDWSVPVRHNIKLIAPKEDTNGVAFAVPYDFDHSGLVKTDYALPPAELNLTSITDRNYRGFSRSMQELQVVACEFINQKNAIYKLIGEFKLLGIHTRESMISYLDEFFEIISKPNGLKVQFIDNSRAH